MDTSQSEGAWDVSVSCHVGAAVRILSPRCPMVSSVDTTLKYRQTEPGLPEGVGDLEAQRAEVMRRYENMPEPNGPGDFMVCDGLTGEVHSSRHTVATTGNAALIEECHRGTWTRRVERRQAHRPRRAHVRVIPRQRSPRARGAGRPRASAARSSSRSGDSGDSGEPGPSSAVTCGVAA